MKTGARQLQRWRMGFSVRHFSVSCKRAARMRALKDDHVAEYTQWFGKAWRAFPGE
jgi:hypothetical protein